MIADETRYRDGYFVVRDGLRLHYRDYAGAGGPPLLCLHGLTRNARDFADFAERHSPRFRVLALDFRGRGESDYDQLPARYNPLTYVGDVIELLDDLAVPQATFVGTSLGGLVTMAMAAMASQRIAASILNDVGPELNQAGLDRIQSYVGKGRSRRGDRSKPGCRIPGLWASQLAGHRPPSLSRARWRNPVRLRSGDRGRLRRPWAYAQSRYVACVRSACAKAFAGGAWGAQ